MLVTISQILLICYLAVGAYVAYTFATDEYGGKGEHPAALTLYCLFMALFWLPLLLLCVKDKK